MKAKLNWSGYENSGLGDPYADIPKSGGDYAKAIAVCINSMHCLRPLDKGVMCPTFRVNKDPHYSPGGRSRLLKQWLNGTLSDSDMEILKLTMKACVACKGCKRECDTNLDMAAIRSEFLYQQKYHHKIRALFFSYLPNLLRYPFIYNTLCRIRNNIPLISKLLEKLAKISSERIFPLASPLSEQHLKGLNSHECKGEVALYVDCFTRSFKPQTLRSAIKVLHSAGYTVSLIGQNKSNCCGRTCISQGDINASRKKALSLVDELTPILDRDIPIIGLEPSCLLMLRDEYAMFDLPPIAKNLSSRAMLFEEFLAKEISSGKTTLDFQSADHLPPVLIHGHCHAKSVGAMKSVRKLMKLIPNLDFEIIESSCCGGAGSFGFESEHYELSKSMYQISIGDKLQQETNTLLVSNGFSCQEQIKHFDKHDSAHIAELLDRLLNHRT